MYQYETTWAKGMNTRPSPSVDNSPNGTVAYGTKVNCVEIMNWTTDGVNRKAGDQWIRLDDSVTKWVAVIHMGVRYGNILYLVDPLPTPPTSGIPDYFDLIAPDGTKTRYVKA